LEGDLATLGTQLYLYCEVKGGHHWELLPEFSPPYYASGEIVVNVLFPRAGLPSKPKESGRSVSNPRKPITILLAEDARDDQILMKQALQESRLQNNLYIVKDGEEVLDYLHRRREYREQAIAPRPDLILLDLYLPKINGLEVLQIIKADSALRRIPIVMLTTSKAEEDIHRSYELGASSYLTKPMTFELLVEAVNILGEYWFDIVELPPASTHE
jgi:CheY-like chemotaxis protein